jgi:hypothetical protein
LLVDQCVRHLQRVNLSLQGGKVRKLELGPYVDLRGELDDVTVLEFGDLDLRLGQR